MVVPVTVAVSLKAYFGHREARDWLAQVADTAAVHPAVASNAVELIVVPSYLAALPALEALAGTRARVGVQDVSAEEAGPFTGEVTAAELAEVGIAVAEIGHAERRRLYGEDDALVARKCAAALRHGLVPLVCVGESAHGSAEDAASEAVRQLADSLDDAPPGRVLIAYEPVWAIGAPEPAPVEHIRTVTATLGDALSVRPGRAGSAVIYGGSAGPGLLAQLGGDADGLFLGRFAHDPAALNAVLDEAAELAEARS